MSWSVLTCRYAWTNVRETRERRENEAAKAEAAQAARSAHLASLASGGPDMYPHSALRLRTTQTSSVRDDPAPSPSPAPGTATPERGDKEDRGAEPDVPPHSLVDRLKAAALVRELQPVHIEGVEPHHLQQQHLATPPNAKPEPERRRSARHR